MSTTCTPSPPVGIFVGQNVDDSAGPPTYERNRLVADLVLNYACCPFLPGPDNVLTSSALCLSPPSPSPQPSTTSGADTSSPHAPLPRCSDGRPLLSPHANAAPVRSIWAADATSRFSGPVHLWHAEPLPPVGVEEMRAFHDDAYVRYLQVRETLSEVDEFSSVMKRRRAESRQPACSASRRSSVIAAIEGDPVAARALASDPHPLRLLPDLEPLKSDEEHGLDHDAVPFVGMWKTIQATVSGTLTAVRWLTEDVVTSASDAAQAESPPYAPPPAAIPKPLSPQSATPTETDGLRSGMARVLPLDVASLHASSTTPPTSPQPSSPSGLVASPTLHKTMSAAIVSHAQAALSSRWAALHWFGGRHHAMRDAARGFCYINDVVLAGMALHKALPPTANKVLIIDLDAHHGDGTQAAFLYDPNYYVLSVHAYGDGVFPHSGAATEVGKGAGKGYTANVTLPEGATDSLMVPLARQAIKAAFAKLGDALGAVILVCGADGLQGDELGKLNYTIAGMQCVTRLVVEKAVVCGAKLLVLGAGGYVDTSTARLSSAVTRDVLSAAAAVQQVRGMAADKLAAYEVDLFFASPALTNLGVPVPDSCEYFTQYGPSFLMHGLPGAKIPKVSQLTADQAYYHTLKQMLERGTRSQRTSISSVM